jgi:hypothetical protein
MHISKDEARILASMITEAKYEMFELLNDREEVGRLNYKLNQLQERLEKFGDDKRRHGRMSFNSFHDLLKRYANK